MSPLFMTLLPNEVVSDQLCHGDFFHYVNIRNKDGLTPIHMHGYYEYSICEICQCCTSNKILKKMAAVYDHFRNFQSCTSICAKMTND